MAKTRGAKRGHAQDHEEHEEHVNHEAWVIPYADMLTLLMALFLVMFAVGQVDIEKFKKLAESFRGEFGTGASEQLVTVGDGTDGGPVDGGTSIFEGGLLRPPADESGTVTDPLSGTDPVTGLAAVSEEQLAAAEAEHARELAVAAYEDLATVEAEVREHAAALGLDASVGFRLEARGLVVTIVTDQVLFDAGSADLDPAGTPVLQIVADALAGVPNDVAIEGHSDSRPISTARYPSNWELSTARATSVLRYLVDRHGFPPDRLSAAGYADTRPIADEATPDGAARNRRVEIVVLSAASLEPLVAGPATDPGADPGAAPVDTGPS